MTPIASTRRVQREVNLVPDRLQELKRVASGFYEVGERDENIAAVPSGQLVRLLDLCQWAAEEIERLRSRPPSSAVDLGRTKLDDSRD